MTTLDPAAIDRCFDALQAAIGHDADLSSELRASRREFFPISALEASAREGGTPLEALAARRHLEWFVLEKERPGALESRMTALVERCAGKGTGGVVVARSLAGSYAGVFEVVRIEPGLGVGLLDLAGLSECTAVEETGSQILTPGDVIAGRVFPIAGDDSNVWLSRAATVWRNPRLLAALQSDLDRIRASRPAAQRLRLRLRQSELESMFHGYPAPPRELGSAVEEARRRLLASGVAEEKIEALFARLASEAPRPLLPGGGDALGEILDDLAFGTSVDLEAARRRLIAAWEELQPPAVEPPERKNGASRVEGRVDVAAAVAEFERKLGNGAPIEEAFLDLERDLDLGDAADEADEEDGPAPDFPGVVAAMVEEFLWDVGREHGEKAVRESEILRSLGRFGADIGVFENLSAKELVDYTCRWLPGQRELAGAEDARKLLAALGRFCGWAQENHDVLLEDEFAPALAELEDSLPRIAEANRLCAAGSSEDGGEWFEYLRGEAGGRAELRDAEGESVTCTIEAPIVGLLRAGDLVRGQRRRGGKLAVSSCHPAQLRRLQQA